MSDDKTRLTVEVSKEVNEEVEDHLDYGDSKSQFTREAILSKLEKEAE